MHASIYICRCIYIYIPICILDGGSMGIFMHMLHALFMHIYIYTYMYIRWWVHTRISYYNHARIKCFIDAHLVFLDFLHVSDL